MLQSRMRGNSLKCIGAQENLSESRVSQIIRAAINKIVDEPAKMILRLALQRLDEMQIEVYKRVVEGDVLAIDRVDRRAQYLGLNAPTVAQYRHSGPDGRSPVRIEAEVNEKKEVVVSFHNKIATKLAAIEAAKAAKPPEGLASLVSPCPRT